MKKQTISNPIWVFTTTRNSQIFKYNIQNEAKESHHYISATYYNLPNHSNLLCIAYCKHTLERFIRSSIIFTQFFRHSSSSCFASPQPLTILQKSKSRKTKIVQNEIDNRSKLIINQYLSSIYISIIAIFKFVQTCQKIINNSKTSYTPT